MHWFAALTTDPPPLLLLLLLPHTHTHTQELEGFLCSEEAQDQCKREMLYRKWSERVFAPVQQGLVSQMEGPGCRELDAQRRELFNKYLSYRNRKVRVHCCMSPV